jgi:GTP-binding protein Era
MAERDASSGHRAGFVAIAGAPNSGKSTLLNLLLGQKISIVTPKPQTTRQRVLGVKTQPGAQLIFLDTPGLHEARDLLNRRMVEVARRAMQDADVVLWLIDASRLRPGTAEESLDAVREVKCVVVALNKIDLVQKQRLLRLTAEVGRARPDCHVVPMSALNDVNIERLTEVLVGLLPWGAPFYPDDTLTDASERSLVAEIVREKVLLETRAEVPYAVAVSVETFEERPDRGLVVITAAIHVGRASQKPILIGRGGGRIKSIGSAARRDIERLLGRRVYLELFVRVTEGWTADERRLTEFGL